MSPRPGDRSRPPRPGDPQSETLRETEALLRGVLGREAGAVRPSPGGLARILAAAQAGGDTAAEAAGHATASSSADVPEGPGAAVPLRKLATVEIETLPRPAGPEPGDAAGRRRRIRLSLPRRRSSAGPARWVPALAAAAVLAILVGGLGAVRLGVIRPPAAIVGGQGVPGKAQAAPPPPLPVYLAAREQGRWALVREFTATTLTEPADRLTAALRLAVAGHGSDPDLTSVWSAGNLTGDVQGDLTRDEVVIRLSAALLGERQDLPAAARPALARLAIQQLVWTATAVAGRDVPVRVEGPAATSVLFNTLALHRGFTRDTATADPRAPVWISSVTDGQPVRPGITVVSGDALMTGTGVITWSLTGAGGVLVTSGQQELTRAEGSRQPARPGERAVFQIQLLLPAPGRYVVSVTQLWPGTGDPALTWTDTKVLEAA
jgi:hypothetical protein